MSRTIDTVYSSPRKRGACPFGKPPEGGWVSEADTAAPGPFTGLCSRQTGRLRPGAARQLAWALCLSVLAAIPTPGLAAANTAVSGEVLDPRGQAVGAAQVYLFGQDRRGKPGVKQVRTRPDGSFAFPPRQGDEEKPHGLLAIKSGYGAWGTPLTPAGKRTGIQIRLAPATTLTGKVVDKAGKPIAGVKVTVGSGSWDGWIWFPESFDALAAVTDAGGAFRMRGMAAESRVGLRFHHPRYCRWEKWVTLPEQLGVTVSLWRAAEITGRVVYEGTRKPAAGGQVSCQQDWVGGEYGAWAQVRTDANGRFRLDRLAPGGYRVSLSDGELQKEWVAADRRVERVVEGKTTACGDLTLTRGGLVSGKVTDRETGAPLSETRVTGFRVTQNAWVSGPATTTRVDGIYTLRLPPGKWRVNADGREGYLGAWQENQNGPGTEVTVAPGKRVSGIDLTLLQAATLKGVVVTPENQPDPKAVVSHLFIPEQRTQPDGSFTLPGLKPGEPLALVVRGSDRSLKTVAELTPRKGPSDPVTIRLTKCVPVMGRVMDGAGRPLKGARVRAERQLRQSGGPGTWGAAMDETATGADGRFTVWLLPGVEHDLKASLAGYGEAQRARVAADAPQDLGVLTLNRADRVIAGRVADGDGNPIPGVRVSVWGEGQRPREAVTTDANGRYRIEQLAAGKIQVSLNHPTYGDEYRNNVETGSTNVDFVLVPREEPIPRDRLKSGAPAPEITGVQWLNGKSIPRLQELRGQVVLLLFATPHNPAVEAASAQLAALHRKYAGRGVEIIAIYDASLPAAETAAYVKARGLPYPVAIVPASPQLGWNSAPFKRYGVHSVPSLFLIDRQGTLRAVNPSREELDTVLGKLVSR
jgi:protocatechuate 3,4-dioxygenase beta subunit